jgi:hypothetical protein
MVQRLSQSVFLSTCITMAPINGLKGDLILETSIKVCQIFQIWLKLGILYEDTRMFYCCW